MNPFIIKGYEGRNLFCDREKETSRITNALRNNRDITLVSLRKMGKTGLIHHVFELLRKEKIYETVYLDIYHTENLNGFINQLATALFRMKKSFGQRMKDFFSQFRFVRPVITMDQLSGLPSVSFYFSGEKDACQTLEDLFSIIREKSKEMLIVIAIDEFQQISNYPEKNVEALIRGIIQSLKNVRFIFSGSNKTMLSRMFGDASRPLYQSTEMIYLEEIGTPDYATFILGHFKRNSRLQDKNAVEEILRLTRRHTWYVQYCCNRLFETGDKISLALLGEVFRRILQENEPFYMEFRNLLTHSQWQVLKAISHAEGTGSVTSGEFLKKFNLTNASSVKRGIEALIDKELIYKKESLYYVYDVFFSRWLATLEV